MKIDDRQNLGAVAPGAAAASEAGSRRTASGQAAGAGPDTAELSGRAGRISQAVSRDTEHRAAVVEQIRAQVTNGSYQPDTAAISRGLVADALAGAATAGAASKK